MITYHRASITSITSMTSMNSLDNLDSLNQSTESERNILIVDDNLDFVENVFSVLETKGYQVRKTRSIKKALDIVTLFMPHVIFIDLNLPDGSAIDLISCIKTEYPSCIYVLMSDPEDMDYAISVLGNEVNHCLRKPVRPEEILNLLENAFSVIKLREEKYIAERSLKESEERYKRLYETSIEAEKLYSSLLYSSADAIVIRDIEGKTLFVNHAFTEKFGWTIDEVRGKVIPYIPDPDIEYRFPPIRNLIKNGAPCQGFETKRYTKDLTLLDVSLSASRYEDHNGNPAGILIILRDISDRKRLEEQLIQAHKMEAIGTLAGGIAHDFNNILQAISSSTQLLLMEMEPGHPRRKRLEIIELSAMRAADLTRRLLIFSSKVDSELKLVDLNQEVINISKILERTIPKMIEIDLKLEDGLSLINADPVQLEQILMNLSVNARDAMNETGKLTFMTSNCFFKKGERIDKFVAEQEEYVLLSVSDTGHGIVDNIKERIFEPFFTTKETGKGTGLGLAMVYGIVKNHNAQMNLRSEIDKGTTFDIYFPVPDFSGNIDIEGIVKVECGMPGGKETILIVDDDEMLLELGMEMLSQLGYNTIIAGCGEEALAIYESGENDIDLVMLDLDMPGMGGYECLRKLLNFDPDIKIIIATGYSPDGQAREMIKMGASGFIGKPYNIMEMSKKIRSVLDKKAGQIHCF